MITCYLTGFGDARLNPYRGAQPTAKVSIQRRTGGFAGTAAAAAQAAKAAPREQAEIHAVILHTPYGGAPSQAERATRSVEVTVLFSGRPLIKT